jgi:predicted metal-dependent hydrolase
MLQEPTGLGVLSLCQFAAADYSSRTYSGALAPLAKQSQLQLIREIRLQLSSSDSTPSDGLIHAIIGLMAASVQARAHIMTQEERGDVCLHIQGLRVLIRLRGGWQGVVQYSKALRFDLYW